MWVSFISFVSWFLSWGGGCFVDWLELRRVDGPKADILGGVRYVGEVQSVN